VIFAYGKTRNLLVATLLLITLQLLSQDLFAARDVKRPEAVFRYEVRVEGQDIVVAWDIEDGYYLYRDKMKYSAAGAELGTPVYPEGEIHADEFFGEQVIFRGPTEVRIPLLSAPAGARSLELKLRSQGCADYGLCYPPQDWSVAIPLPAATPSASFPAGLDGTGINARRPLLGKINSDAPLPLEQAFAPTVNVADPFTLEVRWAIAPGYYLYKKDFRATNPSNEVQIGALQLPPGLLEDDLEFGAVEVYYDAVTVRVPLSRSSPAPLLTDIELSYQGCKKDSICYPPATVVLPVDLPRASAGDSVAQRAPPVSEQSRLIAIVAESSLPAMMSIFLGLGLLLAFTPCCLPMVPILSGIIAGQGDTVTTLRAFWLSLSYVLGMAFTYTVAGALFGAAGTQIQAALQTPLVIGGVSILFVALALAMFGLYELQMPAALQSRLTAMGNNQKAGSFIGTAVMGAVSALVVSTCVAPPLVAALTVIAQTGDIARGALALFAMAMGMGIPLLIIGTSAGKLLPKAGPWMNTIKAVFGFMMLALAVWMLSRLIPEMLTMGLYAALSIGAAIRFGALTALPKPATGLSILGKGSAIVLLIYGAALVVGMLSGATNPLRPLERISGAPTQTHLEFERIKSVDDFEAARQRAAAAGVPLMLDFYADWCVSCKEMEYYSFTDPRVQDALAEAVLVQADVTANDEIDQALLARFGIFGPPTIVFYDRQGNEIDDQRVIGYMDADDFLAHLAYVLR
jgi:thiol:disulfide interchange protein DsbD